MPTKAEWLAARSAILCASATIFNASSALFASALIWCDKAAIELLKQRCANSQSQLRIAPFFQATASNSKHQRPPDSWIALINNLHSKECRQYPIAVESLLCTTCYHAHEARVENLITTCAHTYMHIPNITHQADSSKPSDNSMEFRNSRIRNSMECVNAIRTPY